MAAGTQVKLKDLTEEVVSTVDVVESGLGTMYLGTNKGNVYRYRTAAQTLTLLGNVGGDVLSMALYSGFLYIGIRGGGFKSFTIG
jgi:hypothetical protein